MRSYKGAIDPSGGYINPAVPVLEHEQERFRPGGRILAGAADSSRGEADAGDEGKGR
jgi:hypothetical protein